MEKTLKIVLDDEWSIEDSGSGYTLQKWTGRTKTSTNKKTGEVTTSKDYDYQVYPATLASCIEKYVRIKVVDSLDEMALKDYVQALKENYERIEKLLADHRTK